MMILIDYMMWRTLAVSQGRSYAPLQLPLLLSVGVSMIVMYNFMPDPWNE
jgi:hypothetical protein